eukprot:TRINITY_DN321_c1_g3_i1.p1 TRINITY_DN321_c1_g3~~TRINITY_DN321_c1_g3_i1.p1  ORF type:complete len:615 (+),score=89.27 TRINITY_DN321_c1_g3_i1:25-1845(+)
MATGGGSTPSNSNVSVGPSSKVSSQTSPSSSSSSSLGAPSNSMLTVLGAIFQDNHNNDGGISEDQTTHSNQLLAVEGISGEQILKRIEQTVKAVKKTDSKTTGSRLTPLKSLSLTIASLTNYLSVGLSPSQLATLSASINENATRWIRDLLKFQHNFYGAFSKTDSDARVLVVRSALLKAYPTVQQQGLCALKQTPVIYSSYPSLLFDDHLLAKLGLGKDSIRKVTAQELESAIVEDKAEGKLPFLVIGVLTPERTDDIEMLREISSRHQLWLHVEGEDVALLLGGIAISSVGLSDSISLSIGKLLSLAFQPTITLFREEVPTLLHDISESLAYSMAVWSGLLYVGQQHFTKSISKAADLTRELAMRLSVLHSVNVKHPGVSLSILFRFVPKSDEPNQFQDVTFLNDLNKQIIQDLHTTAGILGLDSKKIEDVDYVRFHPYSVSHEVTKQHIGAFVSNLKQITELINTTLAYRPHFRKVIDSYEGLTNVNATNYIGLGAVRYHPKYLQAEKLADEVKAEIDQLNSVLADRLASNDALFSQGIADEGYVCVRVGVDSKPLNEQTTTQYAEFIKKTVDSMEADRKIVETMGLIEILSSSLSIYLVSNG